MSEAFPIEDAQREGAKVVICLAGVSGGGKTYSALQIAYGLANKNAAKVGLLDTENKRGLLYADSLPGGERFKHANFVPPFSPDRYIAGIEAFENQGCEVLVIDSGSHEWEGIGGCEEIANEGNPRVPRWNIAKLMHKRFVNRLLQSSMHIIVCLRARDKVDMKDPRNVKQLGLQPICEKNFMFEMTVSLLMENAGQSQKVLKISEDLKGIFGRESGYLTIQDGLDLRAWIDGGSTVDHDLERSRSALANACEGGAAALRAAWEGIPSDHRVKLKPDLAGFKISAAGYDEHRALVKDAEASDQAETQDLIPQ